MDVVFRVRGVSGAIAHFARIVMILTLSACGTPAAVKTLSAAQLGYFDKLIAAVKIESDALLLAADIVKQQAEAEIDRREQAIRERTQTALVNLSPMLSASQRADASQQLVDSLIAAEKAAAETRATLQPTLDQIRDKVEALQLAVNQMRQVQTALDGYLQSEQIGESITRTVLNFPTVQSLITQSTSIMTDVLAQTNDLSQAVMQLKK